MEFPRIFRNLKKLLNNNASTLMETLVAMVLIGIVGMMLASGLATALRLYSMGKELRTAAEQARTVLYECKTGAVNDNVTEKECYGEFFMPESGKIICYSVSAGSFDESGRFGREFIYYPSETVTP